MKFNDLTGRRFGKWSVLKRAPNDKNNHTMWQCKCDCGTERIILSRNLLRDRQGSRSCGCARKIKMLSTKDASINMLYSQYKHKSKKRGYTFSLTVDEFRYIIEQPCYLCNSMATNTFVLPDRGEYHYNGVDRIDNNQGYSVANCAACCGTCNKMKLDLSIAEFLQKIELIHQNTNRKQQNV